MKRREERGDEEVIQASDNDDVVQLDVIQSFDEQLSAIIFR